MKKHIFLIIFVILLQMMAFSACKGKDVVYLQPSSSNMENESVPTDTKTDELIAEDENKANDKTNSKDAATISKTEVKDTNSTSNKKTENKKPNTASKNETTGSSNNNSKPSNQGSTTPSSKDENTSSNESSAEKTTLTYEEYLNLTPAKQQEYFKTFDSLNSFKAWLNAAKAEYEAKDDSIEVEGNGSLDLKDYLD